MPPQFYGRLPERGYDCAVLPSARSGLVLGVILAAVWTAVRFSRLALGTPGEKTHHVETAAVILVCLTFFALATRKAADAAPRQLQTPATRGLLLLAAYVVASFLVYWPALSAGFLSDDFVLIAQTSRLDVGPTSVSLFRPTVFTIWSGLGLLGSGPMVFHALNIALHGVMAWLTSRIASEWLESPALAAFAGVLALSQPVAAEPVAWIAGAFDVVATVFALTAVLTARRYDTTTGVGTRLALYILAAASILAKETCAVLVVLIAIDSLVRRRWSRALVTDIAVIGLLSIGYSVFRLHGTGEAESLVLTKFEVQRAVFQTFGALAHAWPGELRDHLGSFAAVLLTLGILISLALAGTRQQLRFGILMMGWILVSIAPVAGWIMIGAHLDGSRYLYLGLPAWSSWLVMAAMPSGPRILRAAGGTALALIVVLNVAVTRYQVAGWRAAGELTDRILTSARNDERMSRCSTVRLEDLPDNLRGAYVFRNGKQEAWRAAGLPQVSESAGDRCTFHWDQSELRFKQR